MAHIKAGKPVEREDIIDVKAHIQAFYERVPNYKIHTERVSFGTSGHRGIATEGTFNELHVAAIAQSICDYKARHNPKGPCFIGQDTHGLSQAALQVVLEVLLANGITVMLDTHGDFVPTPSVSRAVIAWNEGVTDSIALADGIIITPSHNPPEHGGIKYNPPHGGPAGIDETASIEEVANRYIESMSSKGDTAYLIQRKSLAFTDGITTRIGASVETIDDGGRPWRLEREALEDVKELVQYYDFKEAYVRALPSVIDIDLIKSKGIRVLINALGGSGASYWKAIRDHYDLDITIINDVFDPTFSFMTYDHDGAIRMDCSSAYAMASVISKVGDYDVAIGNDPDYDRYGIVTPVSGLIPPNHFLAMGAAYLFESRNWTQLGVGKTVVVTDLIDRYATDKGIAVFEVPVGFKYFVGPLQERVMQVCGEESAGATFVKRNGEVWTTDKDGILMGLLSMELLAAKGSLEKPYQDLTSTYGTPYFSRVDVACTKEMKHKLKSANSSVVMKSELNGEPITAVKSHVDYLDYAINGLKVRTASGWFVARPSGTEDLYKIYAESYRSADDVDELMQAGSELVNTVLE